MPVVKNLPNGFRLIYPLGNVSIVGGPDQMHIQVDDTRNIICDVLLTPDVFDRLISALGTKEATKVSKSTALGKAVVEFFQAYDSNQPYSEEMQKMREEL